VKENNSAKFVHYFQGLTCEDHPKVLNRRIPEACSKTDTLSVTTKLLKPKTKHMHPDSAKIRAASLDSKESPDCFHASVAGKKNMTRDPTVPPTKVERLPRSVNINATASTLV
jgi:hypothetical protein